MHYAYNYLLHARFVFIIYILTVESRAYCQEPFTRRRKKKTPTTENSTIQLNIEYRLSSALWCNYYILFFATINLHCRDDGGDGGRESGERVLIRVFCWNVGRLYSTYHMLLFWLNSVMEIF